MNSSMICAPRLKQSLFCVLISGIGFSPLAAQAGDNSANEVEVISPLHPAWLLEQPYPDNPLLSARTYGDSTYGDYHVKANLKISCHPTHQAASLVLQIEPAALGFDSSPFEGPDATANGPLRITSGTRAAVESLVNGVWTVGGVFQVGSVFAINTLVPLEELANWASDAARGQPLELALAPAVAGGMQLTATFSLPENNEGLQRAIRPRARKSKNIR